MARNSGRKLPEVSSGSMADIAFLLLIFFLVTTTIANDKGITLLLPPPDNEQTEELDVNIQERNIFKILANSTDQLLVENEPYRQEPRMLTEEVKKFILNFGRRPMTAEAAEIYNSFPGELKRYVQENGGNPLSSDSPVSLKAVVSFKVQRGTSYDLYIEVLDAINAAYNEVYGARVGLTADEFLALDKSDPDQKALYDLARQGIPRAISIAKPD
jgi:biopolymer transport protein ExbD